MYQIHVFPSENKKHFLIKISTFKHTTTLLVTLKMKAKYVKIRILNFADYDQLDYALKYLEKQLKVKFDTKAIDMMLAKIFYLQNQYPNYHQLNLILPQSVFEIPFTPM